MLHYMRSVYFIWIFPMFYGYLLCCVYIKYALWIHDLEQFAPNME
jgi:hypothetical protein